MIGEKETTGKRYTSSNLTQWHLNMRRSSPLSQSLERMKNRRRVKKKETKKKGQDIMKRHDKKYRKQTALETPVNTINPSPNTIIHAV